MTPDADGTAANPAVAAIQRDRGVRRNWHSIIARYDVGALERHHANVTAVMELPALSRKQKELIIIAIDSVKAWPGVRVHILEALRAGATEDEIAEAIITAGIPGGPSAMVYGMEALEEILERQKDDVDGIPSI